jgi:hypothetical protein
MVERSERDQMAKFMQALNGANPAMESDEWESPATGFTPPSQAALTQDMRLILERFHNAAEYVQTLTHEDKELQEAMLTERTPTGSRIGQWEIRVHQSGRRSSYDVAQVGEDAGLVCDLTLYEAAHGLVRIFNGGGKVNSPVALELMQAENAYSSALHDAVRFKYRLENNPSRSKATIYEARYSDATRRALRARDRVMDMSECRR